MRRGARVFQSNSCAQPPLRSASSMSPPWPTEEASTTACFLVYGASSGLSFSLSHFLNERQASLHDRLERCDLPVVPHIMTLQPSFFSMNMSPATARGVGRCCKVAAGRASESWGQQVRGQAPREAETHGTYMLDSACQCAIVCCGAVRCGVVRCGAARCVCVGVERGVAGRDGGGRHGGGDACAGVGRNHACRKAQAEMCSQAEACVQRHGIQAHKKKRLRAESTRGGQRVAKGYLLQLSRRLGPRRALAHASLRHEVARIERVREARLAGLMTRTTRERINENGASTYWADQSRVVRWGSLSCVRGGCVTVTVTGRGM